MTKGKAPLRIPKPDPISLFVAQNGPYKRLSLPGFPNLRAAPVVSSKEDRRRMLQLIKERMSRKKLIGKEQAINFIHQKHLNNLSPPTLANYYSAISGFLCFVYQRGKSQLDQIIREDIEAYIEARQDQGFKVATLHCQLISIHAFLKYLIDNEFMDPGVLKRKIRLRLPKTLPRAMDPVDVQQLVSVIESLRDRAMILILLRTGLRIGELLKLRPMDVNLTDHKIYIYEGEKNRTGRTVCLSADSHHALKQWISIRNPDKEFLFYSSHRHNLGYTSCREIFKKYLKKANLSQKGYTLHSLRHTFATELLNAGMRIECLQQLLGHSNLEMTLRYARLSDRTREEEYHKAMAIIEGEKTHEPEQLSDQLSSPFKAPELLTPYH